MKTRSNVIPILGIVLFLTGVFLGLSLSSVIVWGELEASIDAMPVGAESMLLRCPLMLSFSETGNIYAEIINHTDEEIKPLVIAEIGQPYTAREIRQMFMLDAREVEVAQWSVNSSESVFGRLILVNILQSRYSNNPPRWGSCGIFLIDLFGLTGKQSFYLIFFTSIICIVIGSELFHISLKNPSETSKKMVHAGNLLAASIIFALILSIPRWWGLALMLDAFSLLAVGVIFTDFILLPHKNK